MKKAESVIFYVGFGPGGSTKMEQPLRRTLVLLYFIQQKKQIGLALMTWRHEIKKAWYCTSAEWLRDTKGSATPGFCVAVAQRSP